MTNAGPEHGNFGSGDWALMDAQALRETGRLLWIGDELTKAAGLNAEQVSITPDRQREIVTRWFELRDQTIPELWGRHSALFFQAVLGENGYEPENDFSQTEKHRLMAAVVEAHFGMPSNPLKTIADMMDVPAGKFMNDVLPLFWDMEQEHGRWIHDSVPVWWAVKENGKTFPVFTLKPWSEFWEKAGVHPDDPQSETETFLDIDSPRLLEDIASVLLMEEYRPLLKTKMMLDTVFGLTEAMVDVEHNILDDAYRQAKKRMVTKMFHDLYRMTRLPGQSHGMIEIGRNRDDGEESEVYLVRQPAIQSSESILQFEQNGSWYMVKLAPEHPKTLVLGVVRGETILWNDTPTARSSFTDGEKAGTELLDHFFSDIRPFPDLTNIPRPERSQYIDWIDSMEHIGEVFELINHYPTGSSYFVGYPDTGGTWRDEEIPK